MALSTQYAQEYQQAVSAYIQGGYQEAAAIIDQLVEGYPSDPNLRLLRGHVYCCLQHYDIAREQYQMVLGLTSDSELLECANNSLTNTEQFSSSQEVENTQKPVAGSDETYLATGSYPIGMEEAVDPNFGNRHSSNSSRFNVEELNDSKNEPALMDPFSNGFNASFQEQEVSPNFESNPFGTEPASRNYEQPQTGPFGFEAETPLLIEEVSSQNSSTSKEGFELSRTSLETVAQPDDSDIPLLSTEASPEALRSENPAKLSSQAEAGDSQQNYEAADLPLSFDDFKQGLSGNDIENEQTEKTLVYTSSDPLDEVIDAQNTLNFSNDLGEPPSFNFDNNFPGYSGFKQESVPDQQATPLKESTDTPINFGSTSDSIAEYGALDQLQDSALSSTKNPNINPTPIVNRGLLASFKDASLGTKQLLIAGLTGVISAVAVATVSQFSTETTPRQNDIVFSRLTKTGLTAIVAGIAGSATTFIVGQIAAKQLKRTAADLQAQFDAVALGNLEAKARVDSQDELGKLATSFNQMTQTIHATTSEAQRRAEEQEKAKEELQRQVIRLLDDVEGAARGDLTVQAEVTADVLGAVADSFNLTIQNLQKLVQQVKMAARQVSKEATENDIFARGLSAGALRQAEELAVTLNSVQMLTDSIQRVAENAREANKVAQYASSTALKGGESVERTVAGILQIRGTVAETIRKVKRLAESTQEINKIVGLISQIASRTNLLALNASIEAARAGDAGRGFAVVADEVRQLADRSAKASKEIEQIVLQIQGETGQVMTAMEEGTQQVIEGTRLAEQAKQSLEDIIQVSKQIDELVGSITSVTVEQTDTSRGMAQVVQAVELTAQETSQEAQRVSGSLQRLVEVAQNLQASVERFKLESTEVGS